MKEAVTKVIDTLTQEDFDGATQKFLEQYKCIAAGGNYFRTGVSLSDCLVLYPGHSLRCFIHFAGVQLTYSTAPADMMAQ